MQKYNQEFALLNEWVVGNSLKECLFRLSLGDSLRAGTVAVVSSSPNGGGNSTEYVSGEKKKNEEDKKSQGK